MPVEISHALDWIAFGFYTLGALGGVLSIASRLIHGPCVRKIEMIDDEVDEKPQPVDPRLMPGPRKDWWN